MVGAVTKARLTTFGILAIGYGLAAIIWLYRSVLRMRLLRMLICLFRGHRYSAMFDIGVYCKRCGKFRPGM